MKINSTIGYLLISVTYISLSNCKEPEMLIDPRDQLIGTYYLTGTSRFVFDEFGQYWEYSRKDSASIIIEKTKSSDSTEYVILRGAELDSAPEYSVRLAQNGFIMVARVEALDITFGTQLYDNSGLSISGKATFDSKVCQLTYTSYYRGLSRFTDLKGTR